MKKFILYGFTGLEIEKIKNIIKFISSDIKYITIQDSDLTKKLNEIILEGKFILDQEFFINEKIIIFDNIVSKEIDIYFKLLKKKLNNKIIFATTTENSLNMKIEDLLNEFIQEREYFKKNK